MKTKDQNNDTKHTPRPWTLEKAWDGRAHIKTDERTICSLPITDPRKPEDEANARLIAAAPELLDQCNRFLRLLERYNGEVTQTPKALRNFAPPSPKPKERRLHDSHH